MTCDKCKYNKDNVSEEFPNMHFCGISGEALDIMFNGLPIWGCPLKDKEGEQGGKID